MAKKVWSGYAATALPPERPGLAEWVVVAVLLVVWVAWTASTIACAYPVLR